MFLKQKNLTKLYVWTNSYPFDTGMVRCVNLTTITTIHFFSSVAFWSQFVWEIVKKLWNNDELKVVDVVPQRQRQRKCSNE
jgi:hypothetical protein